jgi:hypothetical protein
VSHHSSDFPFPEEGHPGGTVSFGELAVACEGAGPDLQLACFTAAHRQLAATGHSAGIDEQMIVRSARFAAVDAFESAALALVPGAAGVTGARLADGTVIAQIVLSPWASAHSRQARLLPMAWLAALLRAVEQRAPGHSAGGAKA